MSRRLSASFVSLGLIGSSLLGTGTALAAPTCPTPGTELSCGGRIVAEALLTTSFVQFGLEMEPALRAIEALAPEIVDIQGLGDLIGQPDLRSFDGHQLWVARVTDESVPADDKVQVVASLSVHGAEAAGREGGIRYLEDLARLWATGDTEHELLSGERGMPLSEVLAKTETYFVWLNPDGWADGDVANPSSPIFNRGNGTGSDLNREFPTTGWTKLENTQLSEPEAIGFATWLDGLPNLGTASDIHGELTTATGSFTDMMWPAGEWTPKEQAQELQLARNMTTTIERVFEEDLVLWTAVTGPTIGDQTGLQVATKPAQFATAYDIVGYDDSGFMGDFFVSRGAIEIDVEAFLSNLVPNNAWAGPVEQAHVAAVRGIIETIMVEALITHEAELVLDIGNIAIVDDPAIVSSTDADGFVNYAQAFNGDEPFEYDVTRMQYWDDLGGYLGRQFPMLSPADIAKGTDLSVYDSVVVTDNPFPDDRAGRSYNQNAYAAALRGFAESGGQVVLLDGGITILDDLGLIAQDELAYGTSQAGHVIFGERDHAWEADLEGLPQQTFYAVPLGYRSSSSIMEAPHHGVATAAWEEAGGITVGTAEGSVDAFTNLGEVSVGDGSVAIFGAILPTQTEENPHVYGLANYAVTVNGGIVLHEILSYRSPISTATGVTPAPTPTAAADAEPAPTPLPATGGGFVLLGLISLAATRSLRRR